MADVDLTNFDATISLETPVEDYKNLHKMHVMLDFAADDEVLEANYNKVAAAARETVWTLLFSDVDAAKAKANQKKAGELLKEHKINACFHCPWDYNRWIVGVRDEVLKREMLEFWRNHMVANELGTCWARDSDYFDDMEDTEPEAFYKHAGCVAPFSKEAIAVKNIETPAVLTTPISLPASTAVIAVSPSVAPLHISEQNPLLDYTAMLQHQLDVDADDKEKLDKLFGEARKMVWTLLFKENNLSHDNFKKADALIDAYKRDACFYNPYDYNDWIPTLRDELFKRKYFEFWQKVIVEKKCGLCWYKDSDLFDDDEDTRPNEFYKSGNALMKQ